MDWRLKLSLLLFAMTVMQLGRVIQIERQHYQQTPPVTTTQP
ncbi:hypothetical protein [Leptolyngbya phage Lsp-JY17]